MTFPRLLLIFVWPASVRGSGCDVAAGGRAGGGARGSRSHGNCVFSFGGELEWLVSSSAWVSEYEVTERHRRRVWGLWDRVRRGMRTVEEKKRKEIMRKTDALQDIFPNDMQVARPSTHRHLFTHLTPSPFPRSPAREVDAP